MNNSPGYFILSFDMELAWGYYDMFNPSMYSKDGQQEREAVKKLLFILNEYQIPATWAVVGQLFYKTHKQNPFDITQDWNGKYTVFQELFYHDHPLLFAPEIIEQIHSCKTKQEIGFHGHTHKPFNEKEMDPERAMMEISAWKEAAKPFGIKPKSVVFPRNQCGHQGLFKKNGFICFRGVERYPLKIFYMPIIGKFFRRLSYYLSTIIIPSRYNIEVDDSGLINLRASQWLFGFNRKIDLLLNKINLPTQRLYTLVKGIHCAAKEGKIIHVFAHPCEFKSEYDFQKLIYVLKEVKKVEEKGLLIPISMLDMSLNYLQGR